MFVGAAAVQRWNIAAGLLLFAASAHAQVGTTGAPTREEIDPARRQQTVAPTRLSVDGDIERSPCALADPAYAAIKVTLSSASFNNIGPVAASDLAPAYAQYLNREQPIAVVCEIRDAAATILRRMGYLAAVQVPAQRIDNGAVRFEVLYARLTAVRVKGDAGRNEAVVARYLNKLATGDVFNRIAAERYLLLARDIPGMDVRLALKPAGSAPGEMIGEVSIRRRDIEADLTVQNLAPGETGRLGGQARLVVNGLTGQADRTFVSIYSTADFEEQQVLQAGHEMAIGGEGLRFGGRFTYAWTRPGLGAATPDVMARTLFANLEASFPFKRSQAFSLTGAAGLDFVNQAVDFGSQPLSQDRVRVGYLRLDADALDMRGRGPGGTILYRLTGSLELRQGLSIFDASNNCLANPAACAGPGLVPPGLISGSPTATVLRFAGSAELRFMRGMTIAIAPRGQIASGGVFGFERLALGNYTVGRGFDPGALTGDDGAAVAFELRHDPLSVSQKMQLSVQPYVFVDTGWVWSRGLAPGSDNPQNLTSAGAGTRLVLSDRARLDVSGAVALSDAGNVNAGDVRFLMTLTTRLLPWRTR
ncbi:ShlB/FhaC/HecB family hemolysin secretion/activation protein [Sandarakinorhabdus sp.]|uniref:ShlB/FhaC/HecB family hemolysin secretion/activation protein n=1 Tax=Sandarakinorhabdus sp. TaxID=1916663 RepID=UPI00286E36EE|nr:ShlB/FhaC/HecB family hemolysin secretion/activation protein [Sandarakinorhabdus sp.]